MSDGIDSTRVVEYYDNQPLRDKSNARLDRMMQVLSRIVNPDMTVLDIGCGTGIITRFMASRGAIVTGVDISPKQIEFARENFSHPNITYFVGDITSMKFNTKFQLIVMADVFEHLEPQAILSCLKELLANNTLLESRVYVNVPDYHFRRFVQGHYPDKGQIIDEAHEIKDVLKMFADLQFVPIHLQVYGIDTLKQYNEYIFTNINYLDQHYQDKLKMFWGD